MAACRRVPSFGKKVPNHEKQEDRNYRSYQQGFYDCVAEALRLLVSADGMIVNDQFKTGLMESLHCRKSLPIQLSYAQKDTQAGSKLVDNVATNYVENTYGIEEYQRPREVPEEPLDMRIGNMNESMKRFDYDHFAATNDADERMIVDQQDAKLGKALMMETPCQRWETEAETPVVYERIVRYGNDSRNPQIRNGTKNIAERCIGGNPLNGKICIAPHDSSKAGNNSSRGSKLTDLSVFVLHPSGLYYVPATIKSDCIDQSLLILPEKVDTNEKLQHLLSKCHPIAINVKLLPSGANAVNENILRSS
ncbi:unnamed protein product [Soboliphyme baturini]|uniref:UCH domain-containing protein n=1 Tax=Soboliphyme baturini TaxID=241478 RepID=A0A183IHC6_9BILA|nr:unnamed protein product [Soboliphyme baturini]